MPTPAATWPGHGFATWEALRRHVAALESGAEPAMPFMLAYRAVEADDRGRVRELLDLHAELVQLRGTNGNDLLGMAGATSRSSGSSSSAVPT